jgi:hypothetical protein
VNLVMRQHKFICFIDTAELHRVYDNMLQRAQKCIDVQADHCQHLLEPVSILHLHLFNFLSRVRDLRPLWSTRRWAGLSCATLYIYIYIYMDGQKYLTDCALTCGQTA